MALARRALIVDSRRVSTYAVRFMMTVAVLCVLITFHDQYRNVSIRMSAIGREFFMAITYVNLVFLTGAAISFFASAMTEEKEDGALPLLVMTGLGPLTMVTSKFISRLLTGAALLLCQVPFTVLAVTLGGVTLRQIAASYLTILAYLSFLCGMALFFSTVSPRTRVASVLSFFGMTLFYTLPVIVFLAANGFAGGMPEDEAYLFAEWFALTPFLRIDEVLSTGATFSLTGIQFWSNLAFGAAFFALSLAFFNFGARQNPEGRGIRGGWFRKRWFLRWLAPGRTWRRALLWKEFHFSTGGKAGILLRCGLYATLASLLFQSDMPPDFWAREVAGTIMMTATWAVIIEGTILAQSLYAPEIQQKTFQGLCGLPVSLGHVAYGKILGSLPALLPVTIYFLVGFFLYPSNLINMNDQEAQSFFALASNYFFYLHLVVCLSLYLRHGAFLVAGMICVMFYVLFLVFFGRYLFNGTGMAIIGFCAIAGAVLLHVQIAAKLAALRGRD